MLRILETFAKVLVALEKLFDERLPVRLGSLGSCVGRLEMECAFYWNLVYVALNCRVFSMRDMDALFLCRRSTTLKQSLSALVHLSLVHTRTFGSRSAAYGTTVERD
jgi:hypothetical protein